MPKTLKRPAAKPPIRSRERIKTTLRNAFRREFPHDTVDVSDGYRGNIHILVVSRRFDRMSEREKPGFMWQIINKTDLTEDEKSLITVALPVSPQELKQ